MFISGDVFNPQAMMWKLVDDGEDSSLLFREMFVCSLFALEVARDPSICPWFALATHLITRAHLVTCKGCNKTINDPEGYDDREEVACPYGLELPQKLPEFLNLQTLFDATGNSEGEALKYINGTAVKRNCEECGQILTRQFQTKVKDPRKALILYLDQGHLGSKLRRDPTNQVHIIVEDEIKLPNDAPEIHGQNSTFELCGAVQELYNQKDSIRGNDEAEMDMESTFKTIDFVFHIKHKEKFFKIFKGDNISVDSSREKLSYCSLFFYKIKSDDAPEPPPRALPPSSDDSSDNN